MRVYACSFDHKNFVLYILKPIVLSHKMPLTNGESDIIDLYTKQPGVMQAKKNLLAAKKNGNRDVLKKAEEEEEALAEKFIGKFGASGNCDSNGELTKFNETVKKIADLCEKIKDKLTEPPQ